MHLSGSAWSYKNVTLSTVQYLTVEHSTDTAFYKTKITVNWYFSQTPKKVYKWLRYGQKVLDHFQSLSHLPEK